MLWTYEYLECQTGAESRRPWRTLLGTCIDTKNTSVSRGFQQMHGISYGDTYAPVVKLASIECLLSMKSPTWLSITPMDVLAVFFNGKVQEYSFMWFLESVQGVYTNKKICKVLIAFHGLKTAPIKYNFKIDQFVRSIASEASSGHQCLTSLGQCNNAVMIIAP